MLNWPDAPVMWDWWSAGRALLQTTPPPTNPSLLVCVWLLSCSLADRGSSHLGKVKHRFICRSHVSEQHPDKTYFDPSWGIQAAIVWQPLLKPHPGLLWSALGNSPPVLRGKNKRTHFSVWPNEAYKETTLNSHCEYVETKHITKHNYIFSVTLCLLH